MGAGGQKAALRKAHTVVLSFFFFSIYLFICGTQDLLVVVCELLVVACGI